MNVPGGIVTVRKMQRHRQQEFVRFLNEAIPAGKTVHAIRDNYAARIS